MRLLPLLIFLLQPGILISQDSLNWQHLNPSTDKILGISTFKAYDFLKGKQPDTVVVAVLDNGVELTHEALKGTFWSNPDEIPGNNIDDDNNGYIDDIHGWNFLGNMNGKNLKLETTELTRLYKLLCDKFNEGNTEQIPGEEFKHDKQIEEAYLTEVRKKKEDVFFHELVLNEFLNAQEVIGQFFGKRKYTEEDLIKISSEQPDVQDARNILISMFKQKITIDILEKQIKKLKNDLNTRLNPDFNNRQKIVGDNPDDITDTIYGNGHLNAKGPYHGTSVAGVIAARHNNYGTNGIARHVKLMILRVVPDGDERDKDIALGIKYAVQNGADIINCSFGKKYASHPEFIRDAIREAGNAGVLIVCAAGNYGIDIDNSPYFPRSAIKSTERVENLITTGASMMHDNRELVASFSNYGRNSVDILAPGYNIYTSVLNNSYAPGNGTSLSAPVVTGTAAVLKSYYPHLSAPQLKEIIIRSAYIPKTKKVFLPGEASGKKKRLKEITVSGGIVNLYQAVLLAEKEYQ